MGDMVLFYLVLLCLESTGVMVKIDSIRKSDSTVSSSTYILCSIDRLVTACRFDLVNRCVM